ncbi:fumarylpyruvate hydrolase [Roseiarcus fermentans]|uniref:Fumarylpyruvate hydrolase n=1 Tax=Roseiarcus fermentans TaxID=1473586 RepID=A0A366EIM8_9HYPH|nr:fumarylpyruvate hydrolase [Roseiarcus fermentans]
MTDELIFPPTPIRAIPVQGEARRFACNRIFCVGRNYADHAREMGVEIDRVAPFYFLKHPGALVASGATVAYPPGTTNYHYEMELVVAIGAAGFRLARTDAHNLVFGYACGLDMTRRDLQLDARAKGRPWDLGKDFEQSAVVAEIVPKPNFGAIAGQRIWLRVNDVSKQEARLSDLVWGIDEIVAHLSGFYHLAPGDLIFTGTPAGVGPVVAGDELEGGVEGLRNVRLRIGESQS